MPVCKLRPYYRFASKQTTTLTLIIAFLLLCSAMTFAATPTVDVTTPTTAQLGQAVTITGTVNPSAATGLFAFYDGPRILGYTNKTSASAGTIPPLTTRALSAGPHSIRIRFLGTTHGGPGDSAAYTITITTSPASSLVMHTSLLMTGTDQALATGDFNNDGNLDIATGDSLGNLVIYLGVGDGSFTVATGSPIALAGQISGIVTRDFNHDGNLDLAITTFTNSNIYIELGNGSGGFTAGTTLTAGSNAYDINAADVNHDGYVDLVINNFSDERIRYFIGVGNGTFTGPTTVDPGASHFYLIALGLLNGDLYPDLVVPLVDAHEVSVLMGSAGGFGAATTYSLPSCGPTAVEIANLNGDTYPDLAVTCGNSNTVQILTGSATGTFTVGASYATGTFPDAVRAGDFNGDGKLDLFVANASSNNLNVFLGNGDGTLQAPTTFSAGGSEAYVALALGDFNGDSKTDLATATYTGNNVEVFVSTAPADLAITKTHTGNFSRGQVGAQYTITVSNSGGGSTGGTVTVVDTLPTDLTATAMSGTGWSCILGTLTCTRSDVLAASASYPAITLTVTVSGTAASSVTNSVTVSGGGEVNTANDTATDPTTIIAADLTLVKTHTGDFYRGQTGAQYTITVSNAGTGSSAGTVTVVDTLPSGLTATGISGTGWTCDVPTLTCMRSDVLAATASYPAITLTVNVSASAASSVTNSVTVSGGGDSNAANNTATDPTTIVWSDLTITKTHTGDFYRGQMNAPYTITVSNTGTGSTYGTVTVVDTLPSALTATAINGTGWSCTLATLTCTRSDALAAAGSYPAITLTVDVSGSASSSVTNSVTVSGGGEVNTANDTATDATTVTASDLTITKSHTGNFYRGQTGAQYTITVTNNGNGPTPSTVIVTDTLPTGLTATALSGTGWSCNTLTLVCSRSDALAAGASYPAITLTVDVSASTAASVTNSVSVIGSYETNTGNNTANDPTTVTAPDLTIAKSHTGNFYRGQTGAQYTITVTNSSISPTTGTVTVVDTLPSGLTATAMTGTGWSCNVGTLTCTRSDVLAAGNSYPVITLTVNVSASTAISVTNSVTVSGGGESDTTNDTASDPTTVTVPDLTITKTHPGHFHQGQTGAPYTITVSNAGVSATTGTVTVVDTLPTGLTATAISGTGWSCTLGTLTCTRSDTLTAGSSYPVITLTVDVATNAPGSGNNTATVSGGGETNAANDVAIDSTTILAAADLAITKTHTGNFRQGQTGATYTLNVGNNGPSASWGTITVDDVIPAGLTITGIGGTGWTCSATPTVTCTTTDSIASGAAYPPITVTVNVANNAPASVTNTATVSSGGDWVTTNNSASDVTTVDQVADLSITKTHVGSFVKGQLGAQYTVTVSNVGAGPTLGTVTMQDTLPNEVGFASVSAPAGWSCTTPAIGVTGSIFCSTSNVMNPGASVTFTIGVNIDPTATGTILNSAAVTGGGELNLVNSNTGDAATVNSVPTTTTLTSVTGTYGASVLTAHVAPAVSVSGTLSGTVTFTEGVTTLGSGAVDASGNVSINAFTLPVGPHTITATYSGDTQFLGSSISTSFVVNQATLNVTADNRSRAYGASNPTFTASYSGFVNGENASILSGTLNCSTLATSSSPVSGSPYAITCTGLTSTNYDIHFVAGELTITAVPLDLTADNQTKSYGTVFTAYTVSGTGFVAGDTVASLSGTLSCTSTGAAANAPVSGNPHTISCSGLTSSNYTITWHTGTLTVNPVALTLTADNKSREYGASDPAFTVSGSFVAGDTAASLSGTLACITTATSTSPVPGPYPITCSGLTSTNYSPINWAPGQLTITQATPSSTLTCTTVTYDGTAHGCTASFTGVGGGAVTGTTTITYNGSATAPTNANTYTVVANFTSSDPSYTNVGPLNSTLTINKFSPVMTLTCTTVTFDGNPHACTTSVTGTFPGSTTVTYDGSATAPTNIGTYSVSASFAPTDTVNVNNASTTGSLIINPIATTITVTGGPFTYPTDPMWLTITVTSSAGTPSGGLSVSIDGNPPLPAVLSGGSTSVGYGASYGAGNHTITVSYPAQGNYGASNTTYTMVVNPAASAVALTSSLNPAQPSQSITFTATVTSAGAAPTGNVAFRDGTTTLATVAINGSGVATLTTSTLSAGNHSMTAVYAGDTNHATATSNTVSQAVGHAQVTITGTSSSLTLVAGQQGSLPLTIGATGTLTGPVTFVCSGLPIGATCAFSPASVGPTVPANTTVTIATTGLQIVGENRHTNLGVTFAMLMPGMLILPAAFRRRKRLAMVLLLLAVAMMIVGLAGCGRGGSTTGISNGQGTPRGTYVVTVTGSSTGADSGTMNINLTVN